jgi:hypothetical protein
MVLETNSTSPPLHKPSGSSPNLSQCRSRNRRDTHQTKGAELRRDASACKSEPFFQQNRRGAATCWNRIKAAAGDLRLFGALACGWVVHTRLKNNNFNNIRVRSFILTGAPYFPPIRIKPANTAEAEPAFWRDRNIQAGRHLMMVALCGSCSELSATSGLRGARTGISLVVEQPSEGAPSMRESLSQSRPLALIWPSTSFRFIVSTLRPRHCGQGAAAQGCARLLRRIAEVSYRRGSLWLVPPLRGGADGA